MAGQNNKKNVIQYEFQGNILPLEEAFKKVGNLFRRYAREAKAAEKLIDPVGNAKGKLPKDEQDTLKTIKGLYKQLQVYRDKILSGKKLSKEEEIQASKLYKRLLRKTEEFHEMRQKLQRKADKTIRKREEEQKETKDWTALSTQFKAGVQAEQLQLLMTQLPNLPENIKADINSYIEAWRQAVREFEAAKTAIDGTTESSQKLQDATEQLSAATKNLDQKSKEYSKTLITIQQNAKKADSALGNMLLPIANMITSFEFWARIIKEGITLLGDYVESLNFLQVSINNIDWGSMTAGAIEASDAVDKLTSSLEQARWSLGLNATDTNTAAATYISFANAMNLTGEEAVRFSQNMTQLSIDMASLYNKDTIVMMTALRSGLAGNTRALMTYGLSVHDATLNEWLYSKGINNTMTQLSETSQMMVRYMYIMEKTSAAQGDLSRTLKSPANQIRFLRNQLKLLIQNLGAIFNLFIYPAIRLLNELLVPINAFATALTSLADEDYSTAVGNTGDAFEDMADSIDDASDAAKGLSALDEINQMTDSNKTKIGIDADIQELFDTIDVYDNFNRKTSALVDLFQSLGNALAPIWKMLSDTSILDAVAWSLNGIGVVLSPITMLLNFLRDWFNTWPNWLQSIVEGIGKVVSVLTGLVTTIWIVSTAMTLLKKIFALSIWKTFAAVIKLLWAEFISLSKAIMTSTVSAIKKLILGITAAIKTMWQWIVTTVQVIALQIKQAFAAWIAEKAYWKLALAIVAAAGLAALVVAGAIAAGIAAVSSTKSSNESSGVNTQGLATGGVVTQPTFAMIGEGKYNEAVIPLGNSPQVKELQRGIAEQVVNTTNITNNNSAQGGNANVQLNIDGRTLGRASINNIGLTRRQVGVSIK